MKVTNLLLIHIVGAKSFKLMTMSWFAFALRDSPKNSFKKLHARVIDHFSIIQKLGSNAYMFNLPSNLNISPIFNVEDLTPHHDTFESPLLSIGVPAEVTTLPKHRFSHNTRMT